MSCGRKVMKTVLCLVMDVLAVTSQDSEMSVNSCYKNVIF